MNNNIFVSVFKFLFTALSLAIILPGAFESDYRILTLSFAVFVFGKITDNIIEIQSKKSFEFFINLFECILGILAVFLCFFYLAAFLNVSLSSQNISALSNYPVIGSCIYPIIIKIIIGIYIFFDLVLLLSFIHKMQLTKEQVSKVIKLR